MNFKMAMLSDIGIKKKTNQDSCCVKEAKTHKGNVALFVICDGMGGLEKGEVASGTLIHAFSKWFEKDLPDILSLPQPIAEVQYQWDRLIKEQNQNIAAYGRNLKLQLGTTVTAMLFLENGDYLIGHVGDSRAYRITDNTVEILTEDQTVVAREIRQGKLTEEEAAKDPRRNVLLQCVGASRIVKPMFYRGKAEQNQCYMLCSDGFRHLISGSEIQQAFAPKYNPTEEAMTENIDKLIELNKFRHEVDNISSILIRLF